MSAAPRIQNVAFTGGHIPRQCGIATFTADLRASVAREYPQASCRVVAMTDEKQTYEYPDCVGYEVDQENQAAYRHEFRLRRAFRPRPVNAWRHFQRSQRCLPADRQHPESHGLQPRKEENSQLIAGAGDQNGFLHEPVTC